jgi:hypothetical protein
MKNKLTLGKLEVQSFVTNMDDATLKTILGASGPNELSGCGHCPTVIQVTTCIAVQFERSISACQLDSSAQVCGTNTLCPTTP